MSWEWIHENPALWDAAKAAIIGGTPPGALAPAVHRPGEILPGEWWRVEEAGEVLGYGWMDCTWGDAEILLAVAASHRRQGVGAFILVGLEREAAARGLNYLYNEVRATHPDRDGVTAWLGRHGFHGNGGEGRLLKRRVGAAHAAAR